MTGRSATLLVLGFAGSLLFGYGAGRSARLVVVPTRGDSVQRTAAEPAPSPRSSPGGPDLTMLVHACPTIPAGRVAGYLQPATLIHGTELDPRRRATLPVIRVTFDAPIPVKRPAFSVTATVQRGRDSGTGPRVVDRMGSLQLWLYWDGEVNLYKGVRRWSASGWTMYQENQADSLTIELAAHSAAFHSSDLHPGDSFAVISADAGGCAGLGMDAEGHPASPF